MTIKTTNQILKAEGAKSFIDAYSYQLQLTLEKHFVRSKTDYDKNSNISMTECIVQVPEYDSGKFVLIWAMLKALEKTLVTKGITLEVDAELQVGQIIFKLDKELSQAILENDEITYMITYTVNQN